MDEMFLWHYMVLAPPNLVYESMSLMEYGSCVLHLRGGSHLQNPLFCDIDGKWELHATPSWWKPPPKSQFYWGIGAACYAFVWKSPQESLSLYVGPLGAHHSSHMPLECVYGVYGLWGRLLVCHFYGFSPVSLRIEIIHDSEGSLRYETWIYFMESY